MRAITMRMRTQCPALGVDRAKHSSQWRASSRASPLCNLARIHSRMHAECAKPLHLHASFSAQSSRHTLQAPLCILLYFYFWAPECSLLCVVWRGCSTTPRSTHAQPTSKLGRWGANKRVGQHEIDRDGGRLPRPLPHVQLCLLDLSTVNHTS